MLEELRRRNVAAIYGWDCPLLTFIYPSFDCDSPVEPEAEMRLAHAIDPAPWRNSAGALRPSRQVSEGDCGSAVLSLPGFAAKLVCGLPTHD